MTRHYVTKPAVFTVKQIARLGATPGFFLLDDGSVVKEPDFIGAEVESFFVYSDGMVKSVLTAQQLEETATLVPKDLNALHVEQLIAETDFMDTGNLTVCVLTLQDGRKVLGQDNAVGSNPEEQRELAYHDAFNNLMRHEMYVFEGLQAQIKEALSA
ncbi:hypothetical protein JCM19235_1266 [Vibrio maritimus]|uniref:Uncharacterized protein n=1 Tax=Vibrio maritimus TaxID=990268 RepID=A0A090S5I6_9VIBR|nr:hypothetical protein JCM19235_1266 [Vibrio maritimus]